MTQGEQSQFDMSFNTFGRINFNLYNINNMIFKEDIVGWYRMLRVMFMEVAPLMKKHDPKNRKEYNAAKKKMDNVRDNVKSYLQSKKELQRQSGKRISHLAPSFDLTDLMFDLDECLRDFLLKKGILMRYGEDAGMSML